VPGVALGVLRDGPRDDPRLRRARRRGRPADHERHVFPLASISKTVTNHHGERAGEQGQIDLKARSDKYLPDFRVADEAASRGRHDLESADAHERVGRAAERGLTAATRRSRGFVASLSTNMQLAAARRGVEATTTPGSASPAA